jgi:hypothetical protein
MPYASTAWPITKSDPRAIAIKRPSHQLTTTNIAFFTRDKPADAKVFKGKPKSRSSHSAVPNEIEMFKMITMTTAAGNEG